MSEPITSPKSAKLLRAAIWVAIGALIAAAIVSVFWVLLGNDDGVIGKAFTTILLLACFAGVTILESSLADRRPAWLSLASMISWVVALLVGAFLIWMPTDRDYLAFPRFFDFILIVLILQGALLHARLYISSYARHRTTFTSVVAYVTMALVGILAVMLIVPLILDEFVDFRDMYWRVVVAIAILGAVGTALVPLVNALFAPKKPRPAPAPAAPVQAWPTYADGRTPLPVMPDGQPDWNAYYTGRPSYLQGPAQPYAPGQPQPQGQTSQPQPQPGPQAHPTSQGHPGQQAHPAGIPPQPSPPTGQPPVGQRPASPPADYRGYPPPAPPQ